MDTIARHILILIPVTGVDGCYWVTALKKPYFSGTKIFLLISIYSGLHRCAQTCDENQLKLITDIKSQIKEKENVFFDMEAYLPKKNGCVLFIFFHVFVLFVIR